MSSTAANVRIQSMSARWEIEEAFCVDFKGQTAASLDGDHFLFSDGTTEYFLWYDGTGSTSAPVVSGRTAIEAAIDAATTPAAIAAIVDTAIEAATGYTGEIEGTILTLTLDTLDEVVSDPAAGTSAQEITVINKGGQLNLGLISGDVAPAFEETLFDVVAHQTGQTILAQLRQGLGVTLPLALQDYTADMYSQLITVAGGKFTPAAGTELYGRGTGTLGANTITRSRRLVLHPFNKAAADKSEDITIWQAYPSVDDITFSGENPQIMNVTFTAFPDDRKPGDINIIAFGDSSQSGIVAS